MPIPSPPPSPPTSTRLTTSGWTTSAAPSSAETIRVAAWSPSTGWVEFDPTNGQLADQRYITLATGADNLALVGPGRDLLTISGDNAGPVFVHVGSGQLSLTGLTVVSGAKYSNTTESAPGGCIYSQGSVSMDDAGAKYCTAQANGTGDALGGAVYARAGAVLFESTISGSTAHSVDGGASGGGLYSPGPVLAKYSIFRNNTASTDGGGGFGGAAFLGGDDAVDELDNLSELAKALRTATSSSRTIAMTFTRDDRMVRWLWIVSASSRASVWRASQKMWTAPSWAR